MAEVGPVKVTARNAAHAEYVIRSRAEQRGVPLISVEIAESGPEMWSVTVQTDDAHASAAGELGEDTQVMHFDHMRDQR